MNFGLVRESDGVLVGASSGPIAPASPFATFTGTFSGSAVTGHQWRLYVEGLGGDNVGAILDDYLLFDDRTAVPEPASLALLGLGLAGLGLSRRRSA